MSQVDSPDWSSIGQSAVFQDPNNPHLVTTTGGSPFTATIPPSARSLAIAVDDEAGINSITVRDGLTQAILLDQSGTFDFGYVQAPIIGPTSGLLQVSIGLSGTTSVNVYLVFYDQPVQQLIIPPILIPISIKRELNVDMQETSGLVTGGTATATLTASGFVIIDREVNASLVNNSATASAVCQCNVWDGPSGTGTKIAQETLGVPAGAGRADHVTLRNLYAATGTLTAELTAVPSTALGCISARGYER